MDTHMATPRKEKSSTDTKIRKEISLKLLTDKNSNKVVFAEAGKDFVDFLFGLLEVPLGSIMRILCSKAMAGSGSFGRVYESVKHLDSNYFRTNKESLLRPEMTSSSNTGNHPLLQAFGLKKRMSECGLQLIEYNPYGRVATPSKEEEGYVKGIVTYMVMDNLMVKPLSNISTYKLLKAQHVKDFNSLEEKTVEIDLKKGLELLIASFQSDTVLTDVFIGKKIVQPESNASASETSAFANIRIDWKETPEAHIFKADLPGLKKEEMNVEVEEGRILQISGERSKEQEEKNDKWHHVERSSGKFLRRFRLPENVKMGQVKASMENGLLTVTVPKEEEKKPEVKAIEITG